MKEKVVKRVVVFSFIVGSLLAFSDVCAGKVAFQCTSVKSKDQFLLHERSKNHEGDASHTPLVFVPGLKGTHLSYYEKCKDENEETFDVSELSISGSIGIPQKQKTKKRRVWLTLGGLLNVPNLPIDHPHRSLALPLTYNGNGSQDRGHLFPDGVIEHVIQLGDDISLDLFPFYGHATKHLEEVDEHYKSMKTSGSTNLKDIGSGCRPTAVFQYDWRRSIPELTDEFDKFCESQFPGQPVQIVAHSMGGLISYGAMRRNSGKYKPGGVFAGVPFGTGTQYLQDMHEGYYTELSRCRQFTPIDQFTFSSHWMFFPTKNCDTDKHAFVDVSINNSTTKFDADKMPFSRASPLFQSVVEGEHIDIDFYNVDDWEKLELGIFHLNYESVIDERRLDLYRRHVQTQLNEAKSWRATVLGNLSQEEINDFPPLVICATDTIPTVNQILRQKRFGKFEFDYKNGRSVPGDGRIDFDKAFPMNNTPYKKISLDSKHSKQMCKKDAGGNWETIWSEVLLQMDSYVRTEQKILGKKKQLI